VQGAGVAGVGLLAGCGWWSQQTPARVPRVGYLGSGGRALLGTPVYDEAFRDGLRERGYVEGQNIVVEWRWSEDQPERAPALVAELLQLPADVLVVARNLAGLQAAKDSTRSVPIVALALGDAVVEGWVQSLARPGGNITGVSHLAPQLSGKRLELLKETIPSVSRVGMFWDPAASTNVAAWQETEVAARSLGMDLRSLAVHGADVFERVAELAAGDRLDALVLPTGTLVNGVLGPRIADFAAKHALPTMYASVEVVGRTGGLKGYGASYLEIHRRGAYYVDRILKGTKPADLPVEQPTTFDFVINLRTAQALGLTIPQHILLQATEVIQ
jgi:putative ABC transport system substrate-binding protein